MNVDQRRIRVPLSRSTIGLAAVELVDAEGADALTMRSLAKRLGCDPMTLYRYVDDRSDLLVLVASMVINSISIPDKTLSDREWFSGFFANTRQAFIAHRRAVPVIGHKLFPTGDQSELLEIIIGRLARHGSPAPSNRVLTDRFNALIGAVIGYLMVELSEPMQPSERRHSPGDAQPASKQARAMQNKAFGFRGTDDIVLLPKGYQLLTETLMDAFLLP
jgi:AcrR family transcriptional regulator